MWDLIVSVPDHCLSFYLEYQKNIYDLHNDYPLAPEKLIVQDDWLSPFCKNLKEKFDLASDKTTKLIPSILNKKKNLYYMLEILTYTKILV